MVSDVVTTYKAWIALFGTVLTALLASGIIPVTGTWQTVTTVLSILTTAISTWAAPYYKAAPE